MDRTLQYMAYADDVVLIARNKRALEEGFNQLEIGSQNTGLTINANKTKYMFNSRIDGQENERQLVMGNSIFERVDEFKYLGAMITHRNEVQVDIKAKLSAGNRCYYAMKHFLNSRLITRKVKIQVYITVIRPVVLYGAETWVPTQKDEALLNVWERKILRKIYGPIFSNGEWRIRTNQELRELFGNPDIVSEIKVRRLSWLGHLERMSDSRSAKKVHRMNPGGRRLKGRPRMRWIDDIENDLKEMGIRGWRRKVQDRDEWRGILRKAKTLNGL
ncbi:uncharacterized protein LOC120355027 [Nilaparvata lugens]|uniref:uncharacterized protein LOC120355027 n=1 Tax=Nilaparvata lugens TaxID=108931 RepID=UPI00193CEB33|nr:uncharacterized protein LOC120355027 [Nilaparvata lugens]